MNIELFINLLAGHLLADFPLQMDTWVKSKQENKLSGYGMWFHLVVVFICEWVALGELYFWWIAFSVTVTHLVIDYLKVKITHNGPRAFATDQVLHIVVLCIVARFLPIYFEWHQLSIVPNEGSLLYPVLFCSYLFCLSPANYIIREVLKYCHVRGELKHNRRESETESETAIKLSGMLIGSIERFLVLTFILLGNFQAAGLTIAAKSLLRFKDDEGLRTEYVLVGTLLSIFVAVVCALVILKFGMRVPLLNISKG